MGEHAAAPNSLCKAADGAIPYSDRLSVRMQVQETAVAAREPLICELPAHDAALRRFQTAMFRLVTMLHLVLAPELIARVPVTGLSEQ